MGKKRTKYSHFVASHFIGNFETDPNIYPFEPLVAVVDKKNDFEPPKTDPLIGGEDDEPTFEDKTTTTTNSLPLWLIIVLIIVGVYVVKQLFDK
jgi:hypothetical protein